MRGASGEIEAFALYAGQSVGLSRDLSPVPSVMAELAEAFAGASTFNILITFDLMYKCKKLNIKIIRLSEFELEGKGRTRLPVPKVRGGLG